MNTSHLLSRTAPVNIEVTPCHLHKPGKIYHPTVSLMGLVILSMEGSEALNKVLFAQYLIVGLSIRLSFRKERFADGIILTPYHEPQFS